MALVRGKKPRGKLLKRISLVCVNLATNANKYIVCEYYDSYDFFRAWGRIRADIDGNLVRHESASGTEPSAGRHRFNEFICSKTKPSLAPDKRYTEVDTVDNGIKPISSKQIPNSGNIQRVLDGTTLIFNSMTGQFSTPFGIVTPESILLARQELDIIADCVGNADWKSRRFIKALEAYLRLVPHDVGQILKPRTLLPEMQAIRKESDILDSLDATMAKSDPIDVILDDTTKEAVSDLTSQGEMFSAFDIAAILQQQGLEVNHGAVRRILHRVFSSAHMPSHYDRKAIYISNMANGTESKFYVYYPSWSDPANYMYHKNDEYVG